MPAPLFYGYHARSTNAHTPPAMRCTLAPRAPRPDIVLILVDDLGWRDPAFLGSDFHRTPNLDRLAREGTRFTQAYSAGPNCAPSRAALFSGQVAPRTGVITVNSSAREGAQFGPAE